jgi:hypothetical protein
MPMAETDERLSKAQELANSAEGFMSDAEFRSDHEMRIQRYLQSMAHSMMAVYLQNQVILEKLGAEE